MPIIEQIPIEIYSTYFSEEFHRERSRGAHLMQIVEDLEERLGQSRKRSEFESKLDNFAALGFVWERLIGKTLIDVELERRSHELIRPGEQFLDGIYATPDAFNLREWCLEEWKCTWTSSRHDLAERHWRWIVQSGAYCHILGTDRARIRVFHVNGSYKPQAPEPMMWELTYSDEELIENWTMIKNHKQTMENEGRATWPM